MNSIEKIFSAPKIRQQDAVKRPAENPVKKAAKRAVRLGVWAMTFAALGACFAAPVFAQSGKAPTLRMEAAPSKIYQGESFRLLIHLDNAPNETPPETGYLESEFDVEYLGAQNRNSSRISIVNGVRSSEEERGVTYNYRLTPKNVGKIEIVPPEIKIDGRLLRTAPVTIDVIPPSDQDLVKLEVSSGSGSVYPLTPFEVTLSVFVRALPGKYAEADPVRDIAKEVGPAELSIAWADDEHLPAGIVPARPLQEWITPYQSDAGGFGINGIRFESPFDFGFAFGSSQRLPAMFLPTPKRVELPGPDGKPVDYVRYDFKRTFTAERTGPITFDAVSLKGTFAQGNDDDKLAPETVYTISKPLDIEIRDVPRDGRPDDYIGAFGKFNFNVDLASKSAKVGEAITLTVTLQGSGSVLNVKAPKLEENPKIAENFKIYPPTEETANGRVRWTWSLRPLNEGKIVFPELSVSYFDVANEKFETLRSKPIDVTIAKNDVAPTVPKAAVSSGRTLSLERSASGIFGNRTDPRGARSERLTVSAWGTAAGSIFGASLALLGFGALVRRRSGSARTLLVRRIQEGRTLLDDSLRSLDQSGRDADSPTPLGFRGIARAFLLPAADRLAAKPDAATSAEVASLLDAFQTGAGSDSKETLDDLRELFAELDQYQYSVGGRADFAAEPKRIRALFERWANLLLAAGPKRPVERGAATNERSRKSSTPLSLLLIALLVPLTTLGCRTSDPAAESEFSEAIRLFDEADRASSDSTGDENGAAANQEKFLKSAAIYQGLLKRGIVSGPILYNQGNALLRGGDPARALGAWRRAEEFMPSDPYLQANIESVTPNGAAAKRPLFETIFFWQNRLAAPTIGLISILFAVLTGAGLVTWFWGSASPRIRKGFRRATFAAAALFVVFSVSFLYDQARFAPNRHAILSTDAVLRKGASETYEPVLRDKLPALTELKLLDRRNGWLELSLPDGVTGWLPESDAEVW